MKHILRWSCIVVCMVVSITLLAGCDTLYPDLAKPTDVPGNTAWLPVSKTFGSFQMVQVPQGCFIMGNTLGRRDEQPIQKICFDKPFWIDRYKVTNSQYGSDGAFPGPNNPRDNLTWFEVRDFCAKRGARLPTEAEWEYAARGPDSLLYPWGDTFIPDNLVYDGNFHNQLTPVGSRPAGMSWVGAYDMAGDGWDWVSSLYWPYPYNATDGRENLNDSTTRRVYRGGMGSYMDYASSSEARFRLIPSERSWYLGFRCARDS